VTELDLLKEMCDSVPPQREQARARARSRLLAAAGSAPPAAARRRPRARGWLAMAGSAVSVVVVVAAVLAGGLMTDGHGDLGQPASAAELLRLAAAAPAPPAPRPDQFIYVKSTDVALIYTSPQSPAAGPSQGAIRVTTRGLARFTFESWTSVNGTRDGLVRERPCEEDWLPVHNQWVPGSKFAACEYSVGWGAPPGHTSPVPNPPGSYGWEARLPTSRAGLTRYLEGLKAVPGTPPAERIWRGIYGLFQDSALLPASLRNAVYELAASLPGIRLIPGVTDAAGRTGDAIAFDSGGFRQELIFQPHTYHLLGIQESVLTTASAATCASQQPLGGKCDGTTPVPAGTVVDSEAYLQVSVTDSTPPLPPNGAAPLGR
jgi:hypothetical protein